MKTVKGVVISSKPVSLSKAAKILSKFSAADNGATPAYAHYLKRTLESFDELVQLHKELSGPNSERRSKSNRSGTMRDETEGAVSSVQNRVVDNEFEEKFVEIPMAMKEPKKKKRKNTVDNSDVSNVQKNLVSNGVETGMGGKKRDKEPKKARNNVFEDGGSNGNLNVVGTENDSSKKRKAKDGSVDENRVAKKVSKKRKSEEIAEAVNGDVNDSAEKLVKHKKRKKSKN